MLKKVMAAGPEARKKLLAGATIAGDYVGRTLGPNGRNGILYSAYHAPKITNDGVSILRTMVLDDEIEDLGCQVIVEASMKTNERAGDGTTTTGVIASKLVADCAAIIEKEDGSHDEVIEGKSSKVDVVAMSRSILDAREVVINKLKDLAKPVKKGDVKKIVATSLGKAYPQHVDMVAEIVEKVGVDGYISVEENFGTKYGIETEVHSGMRFMGTYASPVMTAEKIQNEQIIFNKRKEAEMLDCYVLVTNHKIESTVALKDLFTEVRKEGKRKICIVSYGYDNNFTKPAIAATINHLSGQADAIRILAIKAPALTTDQLYDVCAYTGATLVNKDLQGGELSNVKLSHLGLVRKVVVDEDHVSMDGGAGNVAERIKFLKAEIEQEKDPSFKEQTKRRLGALQSGFAIIRVGAPTEPERDYIRLKIEDAVNAAKAALEEGVIRGAGIPLRDIAGELGKDSIVHGALCAPYERIKANAGGSIEVSSSVIDPVKVTRLAVENAFSVAAQLVTVEISITQRRKTILDELQQALAPQDNENFRDPENEQAKFKT